jgi:hypothetical protein
VIVFKRTLAPNRIHSTKGVEWGVAVGTCMAGARRVGATVPLFGYVPYMCYKRWEMYGWEMYGWEM